MVLSKSAELFLKDYRAVKAQFFDDRTVFPRAGAYLLAAAGREPSGSSLAAARSLAGSVDSRFDGMAEQFLPLMTAAAAAAPEPEQQLLLAGEAYRACRASFLPSPHLVPAALLLAGSRLREDAFPGTARRAKALFDSLGAEHPFITGYEDLGVCMLAAMTLPEPGAVVAAAELCERRLRPYRRMTNTLQSVTHILAFAQEPETACARFLELAEAGRGRPALPPAGLAALAVCPGAPGELALETQAVSQALRAEPGLSFFVLGASERRLWACLLTALGRLRALPNLFSSRALTAAYLTVVGANTLDSLERPTV